MLRIGRVDISFEKFIPELYIRIMAGKKERSLWL